MEYSAKQLLAIEFVTDLKRRVVAITGQAGTGKTTIMKKGIEILKERSRSVAIAAPTGRAARRIQEATGYPAVTLHKLLGYGRPEMDQDTGLPKEETFPYYHRDRRLPYQDVLVDEYMMVNESLHRDLNDALPNGGRLIAFGDVHQLPPIEPYEYVDVEGAPFERILKLPSSVTLDHVFRQGEDSGILTAALTIRSGKVPRNNNDFSIKISEVPIHHLTEYVRDCYRRGVDYSTLDHQVITPARVGKLGSHALNSALQGLFSGKLTDGMPLERDKWNEKHPITIHVGEKIICNENIYDLRDFFDRFRVWKDDSTPDWTTYIPCPDPFFILNGEVGVVQDILPDGSLFLELSDRVVQMPASYRDYVPRFNRVYDRDPRKKIGLAYAITTHKMQGSECENVTYVMHRSVAPMLNRNNIYTAVTRAKKHVHMITDQAMLMNGMKYSAAQKQKAQALQKKGWKLEAET